MDLLIESHMPIAELGAEARRENSTGQHPPPNRLHVWWARRPLVVSRAAVLGSLLPSWSEDWPEELRRLFPDEAAYREWFLRDLLGIRGDPVRARRAIDVAKQRGARVANPYGYERAFAFTPSEEDLAIAGKLFTLAWGDSGATVADPMAGGGSIPFEALRCGLHVLAGELNPVAYIVLAATVDYPARFGESLTRDIERFGKAWSDRVRERLARFFPSQRREQVLAYLWARTVACPYTGKPVPLSPNWWLRSKDEPVVAVRLIADEDADVCRFEIVRGRAARAARPERGTVAGGEAISPWTGDPILEEYIKAEARVGRMGAQLYAVVIQTAQGKKDFRLPTDEDLDAVRQAEEELARRLPAWEAKGLVPREAFPETATDTRPLQYGMRTWADLFSPRQLLALCTYLEAYHEVAAEVCAALPEDRARAVLTYLAFVLDKCADYNCSFGFWDYTRWGIRHAMTGHDFRMVWRFAEMNLIAPGMGFDWALDQVLDAYRGLARLAGPPARRLFAAPSPRPPATIRLGNAAHMPEVATGSVHAIVVDPPYYANVMYGELSDFFYVWLKRTVGNLYPEAFASVLTDKDAEAVANPARFKGLVGRSPQELADRDYERKMFACFREFHRVLRDDGVLTVMFTHKRTDAWNALGRALIEAGFEVRAAWPVRTESEHSLHQAKKNAAQSTILMVCRKRSGTDEPTWWDDIRGEVREEARRRAREYEEAGITGVDLYLATYGPTLGVLSRHWPVLTGEVDPETGEPRRLAPEEALQVARQEVIALRKQGLLGRPVQFDPVTDFYLLAWDAFRAATFPADEARKLALALDVDLESGLVRQHRVLSKQGDAVTLQQPRERRTRGRLDPQAETFPTMLDALHTTLLVVDEDGTMAARRFLDERGLTGDATFRALVQGLIRAIPATRDREGRYLRPEAELLERLRQAIFPELEPAPVETPPPEPGRLPGFEEDEEI
jgi:putative DNA methylase